MSVKCARLGDARAVCLLLHLAAPVAKAQSATTNYTYDIIKQIALKRTKNTQKSKYFES